MKKTTKQAGRPQVAGERNSAAKLTERDVRAIRLLHEAGLYSGVELAKMFGVSKELVSKIVARKVWKHVE